MAFINPEIVGHSDATHEVAEQCLSIPQLPMPVTRPSEVDLSWDTPDGTRKTAHFTGDNARCIQHELDHLNGRMIFDHQSPEDRATLEAAYAP
jgi:peptide deformylase